ncbi:glycosyltransferase family 2 protein [Blautia sp. MSJ-19]|uniref:glycosyltransferase family 2 protein n=1 Tax=Blautia sp. MSJ-19 TaxID=2841517 RepID=UPI001C0F3278|nr:glycosyltransferase family 2 protein [Blautia sp. MSJ-19]MBU5481059.1 glycosyltransferase family 2 protein [Blautia sp. MSJ-19]
MLVSIVIPCYNSEHTIGKVVELAIEEFNKLENYECEFVLVNDYSRDGTWKSIETLAKQHSNVKGINLAKNFGQHNAIMAALNYTEGDLIIGMDDDMQNHPSQIPQFLDKIEEGYDIVFGVFKQRKFSAFKNLTGAVSRFLLWHLLDRPKDIQMSSFWCCRRYVRDEVIKYDGYNTFLQVLFFRTTHNIANIEIEHFAREVGTSNYNFRRGLNLFLSCLNFTVIPLRVSTFFGTIFSAAGFIGAVVVLIRKLICPATAIGWSSLMCAMLVLFGIVFLMLGIIGEYLGKLMLNVNKTPQYVIRDKANITGKEDL